MLRSASANRGSSRSRPRPEAEVDRADVQPGNTLDRRDLGDVPDAAPVLDHRIDVRPDLGDDRRAPAASRSADRRSCARPRAGSAPAAPPPRRAPRSRPWPAPRPRRRGRARAGMSSSSCSEMRTSAGVPSASRSWMPRNAVPRSQAPCWRSMPTQSGLRPGRRLHDERLGHRQPQSDLRHQRSLRVRRRRDRAPVSESGQPATVTAFIPVS